MAVAAMSWSHVQTVVRSHLAFCGIRRLLEPFIVRWINWPSIDELNHLTYQLLPNFPWRFIEQKPVPRRAKSRGDASLSNYVALIATQGKIPVRVGNPHDFLNALTFLMFPQSKLQLNLRHYQEAPLGLKAGENRTRTQDLLTVFDEGGVLRLIGQNGSAADLIFGHALWEHVLNGQRIRAARLDLPVNAIVDPNRHDENAQLADPLFARWLQDPTHCLLATEFSSLWIEP